MRTTVCAFVILLSHSSFGIAQELSPVEQERIALYQAGILERLDFRNAEVIVKSKYKETPRDPELKKLATESESTARVVVDYENCRCFFVKMYQKAKDADEPQARNFSYVIYHDGRGEADPSIDVARPGREGFFEFLAHHDVPRVEYAGLAPTMSARTPEAFCDEHLESVRRLTNAKNQKISWTLEMLSNGNKQFTMHWAGAENRMVETYDPKFSLPIEWFHNGENKKFGQLVYRRNAVYENINGFTRGKSFVSEDDRIVLDDLKNQGTIGTALHTVDYQWIQFNEDDLKWPDEQRIVSDNEEMRRFVANEQ